MARSAVSATKIAPPRPPDRHLRRDRLVDAVEASVAAGGGVVLISAPAGTGKTTLLTGWLDAGDRTAGWVQVDVGDDDPARLWAYVAEALPVESAALDDIASVVASGPIAVAERIAGAVATADEGVTLVLDDYHLISNPEVHATIQHLVDVRPDHLTLVISTRVDPPIRLARLRVRGQLTELRAHDLRFDVAEAGWLLNAEARDLAEPAVQQLQERTEGWAAGLVLAGLSLDDGGDVDDLVTSFRGDDQLVAEYLSDEFLASLPDADRTRLLEVAVLERMTGPLVDAVTGSDDGAMWLRSLASSNQLVIALDRAGTWFRFHHLLRDLLRSELRLRAPERQAELHAAAGRWYAEMGEHMDAVEHHLAAGRNEDAADLIADHATELLNLGRLYTVNRYLDRLHSLLDRHAGLAIVHGWVAFAGGRFNEAERSLATATRLGADDIAPSLIPALTMMMHVANGDVARALAAEAATEANPASAELALARANALVMGGRFDDAQPHLDRANELAAAHPDHFIAAITPIFEAIVAIETSRPRTAQSTARSALAIADRHGLTEAAQMALAHSIIARTTTDTDEAVRAARRGVELARRSPEKVMLLVALSSAADVSFVYDLVDADELLDEARVVAGRCADAGIAGRYLGQVEARHGRAERPVATGLIDEISERELAVLRYLPSQLSQREIASELFVSVNTVKSHCRSIYRKLGVEGRQAAVQAARDHGLL